MTSVQWLRGGAGDRGANERRVDCAPSRADVLIGPEEVRGARARVVALSKRAAVVVRDKDHAQLGFSCADEYRSAGNGVFCQRRELTQPQPLGVRLFR